MAQPFSVARHLINVLDRPEQFFGFLYEVSPDIDSQGRWLVDFECLKRSWWDRVWKDLKSHGGDRLEALFGGGQDFETTLHGASPADRQLLFDLHARFLQHLLDPKKPPPVALFHTLLAPGGWEEKRLTRRSWYLLGLGRARAYAAADNYDAVPEREGVYSFLAPDANRDPPPTLRDLVVFQEPPPVTVALLLAMHRPQVNPSGKPGVPGVPTGGPVRGGPMPSGASGATSPGKPSPPQAAPAARIITGALARLEWLAMGLGLHPRGAAARKLAELREAVRAWFDEPPWGGGLRPALAGPSWVPVASRELPGREPRAPETPSVAPFAYIGSPFTGPVPMAGPPPPQVANPMQPGAGPHQPFVGIFNVGQGNLNALYDGQGRVVAYYDFGSPLHNHLHTAPVPIFAPCLHDDPLLLLSHWDYDHVSMARRHPQARTLRWIVPEQNLGSASAAQVYAHIIAQGQLYLWQANPPGAAPVPVEHLRMPWGFLERGTVNNQAANINDGGLVMYVCVKDAAAPAAPGVAPVAAPFTPRVPPHHAAARGAAATTDALIAQLEGPLAAVSGAVAEAVEELVGAGVAAGGVPAVPAAEVVAAALAALTHLQAGGAGWGTTLGAVMNGGVGAVAAGAAALHGVLGPHAGAISIDAAITAAEGAAAGTITALGPGALNLTAAAAVVDAAVVAAAGGAPGGAAQAVAITLATALGHGWPMFAPPAAAVAGTAARQAAEQYATQLRQCSNAALGAATEAAAHAGIGGGAGLTAPQMVAAAVAALRAFPTAAPGWRAALAALAAPAPGIGPVGAAAAALHPLLSVLAGPPPTASEAAHQQRTAIPGSLVALVAGGITLPHLAAAVALSDTAGSALAGNDARVVTRLGRAGANKFVVDGGFPALIDVPAPLPAPPGYVGGAVPPVPPGALAMPAGAFLVADAPFDPGERYVLLTGDVAFNFMPSQRHPYGLMPAQPTPPSVVGLLPTHHGASSCFTHGNATTQLVSQLQVPWAPGTAAAAAGAAAGAAMAFLGGTAPVETLKAAAAAVAYATAELARTTGHLLPAQALPTASIRHATENAVEFAYLGGPTWQQVLRRLASPPLPAQPAGEITFAAARLTNLLGNLGAAHGTIDAALAAVPGGPGIGSLTYLPTPLHLAAVAAATDAAATVAAGGGAVLAAIAAATAVAVATNQGVGPPSVAAVAAGTGASAVAGTGLQVSKLLESATVAAHEVSVVLGVGPLPVPALLGNAATNAHLGHTHAYLDGGSHWSIVLNAIGVGTGGSIAAAAAALVPILTAGAPVFAATAALAVRNSMAAVGALAGVHSPVDLALAVAMADVAALVTPMIPVLTLLTPARDAAREVAMAVTASAAHGAALAHGGAAQAVAAATAAAAVGFALGPVVATLPTVAAVGMAALAAPAGAGGWAASLEVLWMPPAPLNNLATAAAALSPVLATVLGGPASAAAAVAGAPVAVAALLAQHPSVAAYGAAVAAVKMGLAMTGLTAATATLTQTAADEAMAGVTSLANALGAPAPVTTQIWPGVATNPNYETARAAIHMAMAGPLAQVNIGGVVVAAASNAAAAMATAAMALPPSGKVAYSYGIHQVNLTHSYHHPRPLAVVQYMGRGWTDRMNTSPDAWHSVRPFPFPALGAAPANGQGPSALGWENVVGLGAYEGPLRGDPGTPQTLQRQCPLCGPTRFTC